MLAPSRIGMCRSSSSTELSPVAAEAVSAFFASARRLRNAGMSVLASIPGTGAEVLRIWSVSGVFLRLRAVTAYVIKFGIDI